MDGGGGGGGGGADDDECNQVVFQRAEILKHLLRKETHGQG